MNKKKDFEVTAQFGYLVCKAKLLLSMEKVEDFEIYSCLKELSSLGKKYTGKELEILNDSKCIPRSREIIDGLIDEFLRRVSKHISLQKESSVANDGHIQK